jgi:hypothetical protein
MLAEVRSIKDLTRDMTREAHEMLIEIERQLAALDDEMSVVVFEINPKETRLDDNKANKRPRNQ